MIKKIVGVILSLAALAIMIFALLGVGTYRSMLPENMFAGDVAVDAVEAAAAEVEQETAAADNVAQ